MTPFYWKLIGGGVLAIVVGIFVASYLARGAKIDRLESWQNSVVIAATDATVETDSKGKRKLLSPDAVPAAISGLKRTADSCASTLAGIDTAAKREKDIQAKLDEQLSAILDSQDKSAESTGAKLRDLLARKATGDREKDCALMEADSNAAWDGWRK